MGRGIRKSKKSCIVIVSESPIGYRMNEIVYVPFSECIRTDKRFDKRLINVLDELSI